MRSVEWHSVTGRGGQNAQQFALSLWLASYRAGHPISSFFMKLSMRKLLKQLMKRVVYKMFARQTHRQKQLRSSFFSALPNSCRKFTTLWVSHNFAGNGPALSKRHNASDDPFLARPKGAAPIRQLGVVALGKGAPFPANHALIWRIGAALKGTESMVGYTRTC